MAVNFGLLVQADILQDYFVDKTTCGPLAGGILTFYEDNARTILKNVYEQTGGPGAYSYLPLPNPLILSCCGTIMDANGNDVIPFYYPYDESASTLTVQTYYVTAYSANQDGSPALLQWTRQNFPLTPSTITPINEVSTNKNFILNKEFWRNIGSINATDLTSTVLAPSAHDGFSMPDIQFIKNSDGAADTISFYQFLPPTTAPQSFTDQVLMGDPTPEYYMNINCTGAGGESKKIIQIPLSLHIKSMSLLSGIFTIQAMNVGGSANNLLGIAILQYLGSGTTGSATTVYQTLSLTDTWQKYPVAMVTPSADNLVVGGGGDDALYIQLQLPAGLTCNINIAMPSFYIGSTVPTNDFDTYDQVDGVVGTPRTGDVRTSLNSFYPYGWVPMNDGVISTSNPAIVITPPVGIPTARANVDTWPLFNLIWNSFNLTQSLAPMYLNTGVATPYGANAISDFIIGNQLTLASMLGRVIAGVAPPTTIQQIFTVVGNVLQVHNADYFGTGTPVMVSTTGGALPAPLVANTVYYAINLTSSSLELASSATNAQLGVPITLTTSGTPVLNIFLVLGAEVGLSATGIIPNNLPAHTHVAPFSSNYVTNAPSTPGVYTIGAQGTLSPITGLNDTTNSPLNTYQPTVFLNVFMKL
jgi:hypothetical protein